MNSAGGRCHNNARCESMWARMKSELLYDRYDPENMSGEELRSLMRHWHARCWSWDLVLSQLDLMFPQRAAG